MDKPGYLTLYKTGILMERVEQALDLLKNCRLCPRKCGTSRLKDEKTGVCRVGRRARVASFNANFGEAAPLVGRKGSGTIFFSSCNLLCSFCQNYEVSHFNQGTEVEPETLAKIMIDLQLRGCHNINLVTPSHVMPQILEALPQAIRIGLKIPLVYNTSAYDSPDALKLLKGIVDIYLPDFKFWNPEVSRQYMNAVDYPKSARQGIREMHAQVGDLQVNRRGIAVRGLLVRHLVMPYDLGGCEGIMEFLAREISPGTFVSLMNHYRPHYKAKGDERLCRQITPGEFQKAIEAVEKTRLSNVT